MTESLRLQAACRRVPEGQRGVGDEGAASSSPAMSLTCRTRPGFLLARHATDLRD